MRAVLLPGCAPRPLPPPGMQGPGPQSGMDEEDGDAGIAFPLAWRPGAVALLDDDPGEVARLGAALAPDWKVRGYGHAGTCTNALQQEPPLWEQDYWKQQRLIEHWRATGGSLLPLILDYWRANPHRCGLTRVLLADHLMAGTDGLATLQELADWPGRKALLTGNCEVDAASAAVDRGQIDVCIPKHDGALEDRTHDAVRELMDRPDARAHRIWLTTLSTRQRELVQAPDVARDLLRYAHMRWSEWICIGEPFGILGIDAWGGISWLQLQDADALDAMAERAAEAGVRVTDVDDMRAGRSLSSVDLRLSLGGLLPMQFPALPAFRLGDGNEGRRVLAALQMFHRSWPELHVHRPRRRSENQSRF